MQNAARSRQRTACVQILRTTHGGPETCQPLAPAPGILPPKAIAPRPFVMKLPRNPVLSRLGKGRERIRIFRGRLASIPQGRTPVMAGQGRCRREKAIHGRWLHLPQSLHTPVPPAQLVLRNRRESRQGKRTMERTMTRRSAEAELSPRRASSVSNQLAVLSRIRSNQYGMEILRHSMPY